MKKLIALMIGLSLTFTFTACSNGQSSNSTSEIEVDSAYRDMDNFNETVINSDEISEPKSALSFWAAYGFSESVALVQFYDNRNWGLINTKGEIIYDTEKSNIIGCTNAQNGVIVLDNKLISTDGSVLASPESTGYDSIITPNEQIGGDYFFVTKEIDTFQETTTQIGIIDKNGQWIEQPKSDYSQFDYICDCYYVGDNHYLLQFNKGNYLYNPSTKTGFSIEDYSYQFDSVRYYNGKGRLINYEGVFSLDNNGDTEIIFEGNAHAEEPDSNAIYICGADKEKNGMYDFDGNLLVDLSKYNLADPSNEIPRYCDGKVVVNVENDQGNRFLAVVDQSGNYLFEPIREKNGGAGCNSIGDDLIWYMADEFAIEIHFIDITGKDIFDPINAFDVTNFCDGLALVKNSESDNTDRFFYIDKTGKRVIG